MYKAADQKAKVNKQASGGQYQFWAPHGALKNSPTTTHQANVPPRSAYDLEKYSNALDAAATTDKGVLEELVKANADLTSTNAELSSAVTVLIKDNEQTSHWFVNLRNNHT